MPHLRLSFSAVKANIEEMKKALHLLHEHFMCVETIRAHESFAVEAVLHLGIGYAALITSKAILAAPPCRTARFNELLWKKLLGKRSKQFPSGISITA